ncbi:MAG: hypothetical protein VW907_07765 [Opitutae bacterium]
MKKLFFPLFFILLGCAAPTAFMGEGILSLGVSKSASQAALSAGSDYIIKKETGKNKIEYISSKVLKKDCSQKDLVVACK